MTRPALWSTVAPRVHCPSRAHALVTPAVRRGLGRMPEADSAGLPTVFLALDHLAALR